jgi:hypothetical protein
MLAIALASFLVLFKVGSFLRASRHSARPAKSEAGVAYRNDRIASEPWSIHLVQVDRSRPDLGFYSAHARNQILGVSMLGDQARAIPAQVGQVIAGVNGDFYIRDHRTYAGDPRGIQIIQGELVSGPSTVCVWFDAAGNPHLDEVKGRFEVTWPDGRRTPFGLNEERTGGTAVLYTPSYGSSTRSPEEGREILLERDGDNPWLPLRAGQTYQARVKQVREGGDSKIAPGTLVLSLGTRLAPLAEAVPVGTVIRLSTATTPDLSGAQAAIAGGPAIIKDGVPFKLTQQPTGTSGNYSEASKYQRHPRSAIGWSPTHVYLVTVDGRQPGLSVGMKLAELAQYMVELGCTDAMNLDGGKSAQMWMKGQIMNDPCQGEDTVANSIFVIRKPTAP